jgi:hypothetical protein
LKLSSARRSAVIDIDREIVGRTAVLMLTEDLPHDAAEARAINEIAVETKLGRRMALSRLRPTSPVAANPTLADDAAWVRRFLLEPVRLVLGPTLERYVPSPSSSPPLRKRSRREAGPNPLAEPADQPATILGPLLYVSGDGVPRENINAEFENDPRFRRVAGFAVAADEATRNWPSQNR